MFECTKRAKELLLRAVSGDDGGDLGEEEEAKAELLSRMRQLTGGASAPDLAKALESAADAAVRTAREERDRLDVREEAEKARCEFRVMLKRPKKDFLSFFLCGLYGH